MEAAKRTWAVGRAVLSQATVEPMLALYTMGYTVSGLAMQNLNLEKACLVNLGYNGSVCRGLELRETRGLEWAEEEVQRAVTGMGLWKSALAGLLPAVVMPFAGAWSDRRGRRKPCWQVPLLGEFLTCLAYLAAVHLPRLPMEACGLVEALLPSLTGGWMTLCMAVFSYLGDVTSPESRTLRMGLLGVWPSVSVTLGQSVSGLALRWLGYDGVFLLSAALLLTAAYLGWRVPETGPPSPLQPGLLSFLRDFFDTAHLKDTVAVVFRSRQRLRVALLLAALVLVSGPGIGEMTVMYIFTRLRFNWNEVDYSYFLTFIMVINLIGTSITVGVLSHKMKVDDAVIGIISCVSKILAGFIYAFATTTWMIYLAPLVDIANGTSYIAMRSIASKLVPPDELGKLNSVFGMAEAVVPVIYGPMYNAIYQATRQTVPGAFFLIGGALTAPAVFIFLWLYGQHRQDAARLAATEAEKGKTEMGIREPTKEDGEVEKERNGTLDVARKESAYSNEGFEPDSQQSKL